MSDTMRRRWTVPAVLTVQVLALGCPDGDDDTSGGDTGTVATDSSDTGEWVDCASLAGAECEAHPRCADRPEFGGCVLDCVVLDETDCTAVPHCIWLGDACDYEPLA
jgi:hypothetical protein